VAEKILPEHKETLSESGRWLEEVYLAHKDDLLTSVMCLLGGRRSMAEDVLHDVFATLAKPPPPEIKTNVRNYVITACLNRARDLLRRRDATVSSDDQKVQVPCNQPEPVQALELAEEASRVFRALATLPDTQREVVAMRIHGGMTFREIAETLGISINTVQSRYRYALSALRNLLDDSQA
jgi:RNA polymerase sigma factor (sigma-70 family)